MFGSKSTKNAQSDFTHFKQVLFNHSVDNEPSQKALFDSHQVEQILNYVQTGYIQHYKLYSYVKVNPAVVQDLEKIIYIDEPIQVPPLSQALQFDSNKIEENQVQEQECKEILLEEKEINLLDAESQEIIQNRLAELRQEMQNQIEQRQQMLDEKLIALQDPKKKK